LNNASSGSANASPAITVNGDLKDSGNGGLKQPQPAQSNTKPLGDSNNANLAPKAPQLRKTNSALKTYIINGLEADPDWKDPNPHGRYKYVESKKVPAGRFSLFPIIMDPQYDSSKPPQRFSAGDFLKLDFAGSDKCQSRYIGAFYGYLESDKADRRWCALLLEEKADKLWFCWLSHVRPTDQCCDNETRERLARVLTDTLEVTAATQPFLEERGQGETQGYRSAPERQTRQGYKRTVGTKRSAA
jgi:hypothetical protein